MPGLTISREKAREVFARALERARSAADVPGEWVERTRRVGESKSTTFVPALGTVLLSKASDPRIDAFSLSKSSGHKGYSARGVAKEVLVPCCVKAGIDIRSSVPEPLNNQPFFGSKRINEMTVKDNVYEDWQYLCRCVEAADFLGAEEATAALAAFLRARIEATQARVHIELGAGRLPLTALEPGLDTFVDEDPDGGKTAQAVGAAVLQVAFDDVRSRKVNDPSVNWPGDIGVYFDEKLAISVEVKQKPTTDVDIVLFANRLRVAEVQRGMVLAFAQGAAHLDTDEIRTSARSLHGIEMTVFERPSAFLVEALRWSGRDVVGELAEFPNRVLQRLNEIGASNSRLVAWAALFK